MATSIADTIQLADGHQLPNQGFSTEHLTTQAEVTAAVQQAWDAGYRQFDTAMTYRNEDLLGKALQTLTLPREALFLTTKVAEIAQGHDTTLREVDGSLHRLGTDYLDLLLIHWPVHDHFFDTWQALEDLQAAGKVKSIGVANYNMAQLELLATQATTMPVVNQIEYHPYFNQQPLVNFAADHHIMTQAWRPLAQGAVLDNPMLQKIAQHYHKNVAQVVLRWDYQHGVVPVVNLTETPDLTANAAIYDFALTPDDMTMIDLLHQHHRTGADPEVVYEEGHEYQF